MAQPTPYIKSRTFADSSTGVVYPVPASFLDVEFGLVQIAIGSTDQDLKLIQRDDGALANAIVTPDSLSAATVVLLGGWNPRGSWVTGTAYSVKDLVARPDGNYIAVAKHVSNDFPTDLASGDWQFVASTAVAPTTTVNTFSVLRAFSSAPSVLIVGGRTVVGDGGGGTFTVDSTDTTSADNGGTIIVDVLNRRWKRQFSGALHAAWFGAKGDSGTTDNVTAFAAARDAAIAAGGGRIMLGAGSYALSSEINTNNFSVHWQGMGPATTRVYTTSPTANIFKFSGSAFDCSVSDMRLTSTATTPTAGAAIYCQDGVADIFIERCRIENTWNGVETLNTPNFSISGGLKVDGVNLANCVNDCFHINGMSTCYLSNVSGYHTQNGAGHAGLFVQAGGGFYVSNTTMGGMNYGFMVVPGSSANALTDFFFSSCEADSCNTIGWNFDTPNGGSIDCVKIGQSRAGFCNQHGWYFSGSGLKDVSLSGCTAQKNGRHGFAIFAGANIELDNCVGANNSSLGAGYFAIAIVGGQDVSVKGGSSAVYQAGAATQDYGVAINSLFTGTLLVDGFNARAGWTVGSILNGSTSTKIKIINCAGFNPRGRILPALGASPATYTAGSSDEQIILQGGTTSSITYNGSATLLVSPCTFVLAAGQQMTVTYTVVPSFVVLAL